MTAARLGRRIGMVLAGLLAMALLASTAYFESSRRVTLREIDERQADRDRLRSLTDELESRHRQAESDRHLIMNVLGQARSVEDIADLHGNRVAAQQQGLQKLSFYVPQGSHTLEISMAWKPQAPADLPGDQTWRVPLEPASGYQWMLASRRGEPIRWKLVGNHPDFTSREETVADSAFVQSGFSLSGGNVLAFPNQIERFSIKELEANAARPGLDLVRGTLNLARRDQSYELAVDVRLVSDAPACVSASDAVRILTLGRAELLLPYAGGGAYHLSTPRATPSGN